MAESVEPCHPDRGAAKQAEWRDLLFTRRAGSNFFLHRLTTMICRSHLLHKLSRPALAPGIVRQAEAHAFANRRVGIKHEYINRIGIGIRQTDLTQNLKTLRRDLAGIGRKPMRDFQPILVSLVLKIPADRAFQRICNEGKQGKQQQ